MPSDLFSKENSWFLPLFSELTVTNIAYFATLTMLAVHMVGALGFSPAEASLVWVASSIGLRFSRIALAPFIDRIAPGRVIPLAIALSMAGYVGLWASESVGMVALCIFLVGTGYGINGMLVTTLASYTAQRSKNAFPMYALMNTGTNLAASIAPVAANALRLDVSPGAPFLLSAAVLVVSLLVSLRIRADIPSVYRQVRFTGAASRLLRNPRFWAALGFVMVGWAVYIQKFAITPLFINDLLHRPGYVGLAVTINALIVLFVSLPLGRFIASRHIDGHHILVTSFTLYAAAYGLLAAWPSLAALWPALALWSLGEALLMPQLNALIAEYTSAEDRLAGFSLSAVAIGIGEASGSALGIALFSMALASGSASLGYAVLCGLAALVCAAAFFLLPSFHRKEATA